MQQSCPRPMRRAGKKEHSLLDCRKNAGKNLHILLDKVARGVNYIQKHRLKIGERLCQKLDAGEAFIGVAEELSEEPVYVGIEGECVQWFSYERQSDYEWANIAMLDTGLLAFRHTHFYVQLEKFLPTKALIIERIEVDTGRDLIGKQSRAF